MHELSLCQSIRELLEEQAVAERFDRVRRIWLDIGPFSCVEPEALRFGFASVMRGSVAEGAELEIAMTTGEARCLACGAASRATGRFDPCPACGAAALQVTGGDELKIRKLEVV